MSEFGTGAFYAAQVKKASVRPSEETGFVRLKVECLTIRLRPELERVSRWSGRLDSNQHSYACRVSSRGRTESPRPDSNRILPCTRRVLGLLSCMGRARGAGSWELSPARAVGSLDRPSGEAYFSLVFEASASCKAACRASTRGRSAPAEGIEPSSTPINSRVPDHSASLE